MKNFFLFFISYELNPLQLFPFHSFSTAYFVITLLRHPFSFTFSDTAYFAITLLRHPFSNFVSLLRKLYLQKQHHLGQRVDLCACLSYLLLTPLGINLAVDGPSALHYIKYQCGLQRYEFGQMYHILPENQ